MATGGIFQLVTNDGRQDRMLMATALLNRRLALVTESRKKAMFSDPTPTLADVEKTHIIFTNAHFKPFAAIGYEYNKVRPNAGTPALGQHVVFSLPQFGDFFHDMVLHVRLKQPTLVSTTNVDSDKPAMRWCAYPGERLLKNVQFIVNGNPLDNYTSTAYNFHREFSVPPHKKAGWDRCMGQETAHEGFVDQQDWVNSGAAPVVGDHRFLTSVVNGFQTPTGQKDQTAAGDLEMFIPLLFWCNKDPRLSVPSVAIPFGQRYIELDLADQSELVNIVPRGTSSYVNPNGSLDESVNLVRNLELYVNNIFVNPEVHDIFIKRIGFNLIRVHRQQTHHTSSGADEVLLQQLKWPCESLCVGMRVKDYNSSSISQRAEHIDKWHAFSQVTNTSFSERGWSQYKDTVLVLNSPADVPAIAAVDAVVTATTITRDDDDDTDFTTQVAVGDRVSVSVGTLGVVQAVLESTVLAVTTTVITLSVVQDLAFDVVGANTFISMTIHKSASRSSTVQVYAPTLDTVTIKAHGIPIYNDFPSGFYNSYLPFHFGGGNINTPKDCGALLITFCLYPGTYQPSGHINISRAREFYLEYTSSVIGAVDGTLLVIASSINFLLISDGSAVLRYST